jgi:hypothetical protein
MTLAYQFAKELTKKYPNSGMWMAEQVNNGSLIFLKETTVYFLWESH